MSLKTSTKRYLKCWISHFANEEEWTSTIASGVAKESKWTNCFPSDFQRLLFQIDFWKSIPLCIASRLNWPTKRSQAYANLFSANDASSIYRSSPNRLQIISSISLHDTHARTHARTHAHVHTFTPLTPLIDDVTSGVHRGLTSSSQGWF